MDDLIWVGNTLLPREVVFISIAVIWSAAMAALLGWIGR